MACSAALTAIAPIRLKSFLGSVVASLVRTIEPMGVAELFQIGGRNVVDPRRLSRRPHGDGLWWR